MDTGKLCPAAQMRPHDPAWGPQFVRGKGPFLWDTDDRQWMDLTCGFGVSNFGHAYPPLVEIATKQIRELSHLTGDLHPTAVQLSELLAHHLAPQNEDWGVLLHSSGARAVESAIAIAQTSRPGKVLSLAPAFHGRTLGVAPLSSVESVAPGISDRSTFAGSYPYCQRCPFDSTHPACALKCASDLFATIERDASSISCICVEPAIGARGYLFPPAEFFRSLRKMTSDLGVLIIADEVQTGLGRCGDWTLSGIQGWQPDVLVVGKSLGAGIVPVSATLAPRHLIDGTPEGFASETFAATPLATGVGVGVMQQLADGDVFENASVVGETLRTYLREELSGQLVGCHVDGVGAVATVEVGLKSELDAERQLAKRLVDACIAQRLRVHWTGPQKTRMVLLPQLVMTAEETAEVIKRLGSAFQSCI